MIAAATFAVVLVILYNVGNQTTAPLVLFEVLPGLDLAFNVEPLGLMFALLASGLWMVTHIYAIGYMRTNKEKHHARFFACFSFAIFSVMGIAFAANMFTLFLFYEALTLSTYPLVAHKGTPEAIKGARTYLGVLISTSIGLQLVAIIWTFGLTGTLDFTQGGILQDHIAGPMAALLLALYAFGIGKAALMPFHRWLPAAMVAPTPVSALLHAVAVVKAGVFTMLKIGVYIFGIDFLATTGASVWLMWLAAFSIVAASVIAMTKDNLKARLAYSTISQLSYVTLGMALATSIGIVGGGLHVVMHAMGKITLFMCAGSIYVATRKTEISDMSGLGLAMPITFGAFLIGALSIIGLPPLGGSWSKWLLMMGAVDTGQMIIIAVLLVSSLLNVAYLMPIVGKGFFIRDNATAVPVKNLETSPFVWGPPAFTALGCVVLFFFAGYIEAFLMPLGATN
ncbi:MAG: cation:proton antiporter [Marinovum sp.]|nr:cation:proton antiporter [Marinovum sp.]